nr:reverse transcriptase domain-containing protein [Tanacetum cinerariifolium]
MYVDEGSSVEVMFEHCFDNLNSGIKSSSPPKGVATLVTRTITIAECIRLEKKQVVEEEISEGENEVSVMEEVMVNTAFPHQLVTIGGEIWKHVDDMVIKSRDEKMLLADVAETFDNLRKFNMKLNPKKCSFGVE